MSTWDFFDSATLEELTDEDLPEHLRSIGIDSIEFRFHCTGYHQPMSMYGGHDHLGWPEEFEDIREIVGVKAFDIDGNVIRLTREQDEIIKRHKLFHDFVKSLELDY